MPFSSSMSWLAATNRDHRWLGEVEPPRSDLVEMLFDFTGSCEALSQQVIPNHVHRGDLECNALRHGDREIGIGGNAFEAGCAEQLRKLASERKIDTAIRKERPEPPADLVRKDLPGLGGIHATQGLEFRVCVFDHEPAARLEGGEHVCEGP